MKHFLHLRAREAVQINDVRPEDVASSAEYLKGMTHALVARGMAVVRSFHTFAFEEGRTDANLAADVRPPKTSS